MELRSVRTLRRSPPPPPTPHGGRSKRRRGPGVEADRISTLPDEMLLLILTRLRCVRTAVQTGLLSRRWRSLWTGLTDLAFCRLAPSTIEAVLALFPRSTAVSLCDVAHHYAGQGNSLLRFAARLSPEKLVFTLLEPHRKYDRDKIELPCLPSTTSVELHTQYLRVKLPPAGEFTALERLSIYGRISSLGDWLNLCPRLRVLSVVVPTFEEELFRLTPPPVGEFTALESLSLTGRIDGLGSFLNRCRHLRVLSVTYTDSRQLTLPSDGEFPVLEKLSLSGNIANLGTSLKRCPCLRILGVTFRGVSLHSIEEALTTLEEVGLPLCLLGIDSVGSTTHFDAPRFTALLRAVARLSPQEFAFKHFFDKHNSVHLPSFPRTTSIDMDLNTSIRFRRIPEAAADFSALQRLSLSGGCRPVNLATMVSRCKQLRELSVTVSTGKIKVHSASLHKLYASTGRKTGCRRIDIVAPALKQLELVVGDNGGTQISVSISAPWVEQVSWKRLEAFTYFSMPRVWHLQCLKFETTQDTCSAGPVLCMRMSASKHLDAQLVFTKEMEALLIPDFSVLQLYLEDTSDHLFGSLVLRLFGIHRIRAATKRLKLDTSCFTLQAMRTCPITCPCDGTKNRAKQNVSSTCLEDVEMANFSGHHCEHDFLTRILGCSPMLKRVSLKLSPSGTCTKEVEDILLAYPSVSCYVYSYCGKRVYQLNGRTSSLLQQNRFL